MGELILIRHGQTEWSLSGQHAGRTDVPLTAAGEAAARALAPRLASRRPGEELQQVAARVDAVLGRVRTLLRAGEGDVAVVAHGHLTRVLTVRWLGLDAAESRMFGHPHPGSLSFLAEEDGQPYISAWNVP
ncbi:histidine phosphatase family protein [Streptomyces sp. SKN60]|uniref:histidine phosphatase family protein n=1 Tax=Streptomyces sp. SKN60 TaxID=2855506 RepID=UPI0022463B52|nr:histidine phosphatase family protein [Streptomyces sp. SKN60]MCX2181026.1 histidine phosphatase family protein [Streptomyces sp. SKN60]